VTGARPPLLVFAAALFALALSLVAAPASAAPTFPALTGRVVDDAHVLSAATVTDLTAKLADLETKTGRQLVVVTLPSLQGYEIEDYGYQLGRAWGIGQKGKDNGVLFIVAPTEHKVRIEVGYGLEPILTDTLSSVILQEQVLPKLRAGDVDGGVVAGTNAIIGQLSADPTAAAANVQQATQAARAPHPHGLPFGAIIVLIILFFVFSGLFRSHMGGGMGWLLPMMILSSGSRGGGWGGGDGGGFGGGGFSGGGGSFGGGGASGSW
jgi:uncharacterized protein